MDEMTEGEHNESHIIIISIRWNNAIRDSYQASMVREWASSWFSSNAQKLI